MTTEEYKCISSELSIKHLMFKILHLSDTHFALTTDGVENHQRGMNTRAQDGFQAFYQACDYAVKNNIKIVVFSGDIFNSKIVSQNIVYAFFERIQKLR